MRTFPANKRCSTTARRSTRISKVGTSRFPTSARYDELPKEARRYLEFIEDQVGVPIGWVSVGR